jgi:hypothetical protein
MGPLTWAAQHRLWALGIGFLTLVTVAVAVGAGFWYLVLRSPRTQVNLAQALRLYRHDQKGGGRGSSDLPQSGVYRYRSSGSEQLSVGDISRSFPAASDMIVTDGDGCATMKWEPLEEHMEGLVACPDRGGGLEVKTSLSYEEIAGTYFVPPHATVGQTWRTTCHEPGENVVFAGRVLGRSLIRVGRSRVPAIQTRLTSTFSGDQSGTSPATYWISLQNGLILRQLETVAISQQAGPLGPVHYTEQMAIALNSAVPDR